MKLNLSLRGEVSFTSLTVLDTAGGTAPIPQ